MNMMVFSRDYFSRSHLSAACLFTRKAGELENEFLSGGERKADEHRAYVTWAVMLSAAFLEATINEIFSDCADEHEGQRTSIAAGELMGRMWKLNIPRTAGYSIVEKFDVALELNGKNPDDVINKHLRAKIILLASLRNALIHFEPETIVEFDSASPMPAEAHKFEKRFKGKFVLNPLKGHGNAFYPDQILGHGCAAWAVKIVVEFADAFSTSIGVKPKYESLRHIIAEVGEIGG